MRRIAITSMFCQSRCPMNSIRILVAVTLLVSAALGRAGTVRYEAQPEGSKMKIDGTSTLHDWTVECAVIGGFMEFDATFPEGATGGAPSAVKPRVEVTIPVRQLKSGKKSMDSV